MYQWATILLAALAACGGTGEDAADRFVAARPIGVIISDTAVGTVEGTWKAAQTPFEDIGIKREPIPPILQALVKNPYIMRTPINCADIRREIVALDAVLGADVCTSDNPTGMVNSRKGEYIEAGAGMAREQAVSFARSYLDVLPFRGVVRSISGADKHARDIVRAYEAGKLRRSFLRGIAYAHDPQCLKGGIR